MSWLRDHVSLFSKCLLVYILLREATTLEPCYLAKMFIFTAYFFFFNLLCYGWSSVPMLGILQVKHFNIIGKWYRSNQIEQWSTYKSYVILLGLTGLNPLKNIHSVSRWQLGDLILCWKKSSGKVYSTTTVWKEYLIMWTHIIS